MRGFSKTSLTGTVVRYCRMTWPEERNDFLTRATLQDDAGTTPVDGQPYENRGSRDLVLSLGGTSRCRVTARHARLHP